MYTKEQFAKVAQRAYDEVREQIKGVYYSISDYTIEYTFLSTRGKPNNKAILEFDGEETYCIIYCRYIGLKSPSILADRIRELLEEL